MKYKIYQIDAFADKLFTGNPAAVIPLNQWLPDETLQAIAEENNLSETVYFIPEKDHYRIRWFTPNAEVKLCGHATLASAFVLFEILNHPSKKIIFESLSGPLEVDKENDFYVLNFPQQPLSKLNSPEIFIKSLGKTPVECLTASDTVAVFEKEDDIINFKPDFLELAKIDTRGVIITAPSKKYDFVCRFFAPRFGILEDPVTGSAYTQLAPYWSKRLNKKDLDAKQLSKRGGEIKCKIKDNRVLIYGKAIKFMEGDIDLNNP